MRVAEALYRGYQYALRTHHRHRSAVANVFRTKEQLLIGVVDYLLEADRLALSKFRLSAAVVTPNKIPTRVAQFVSYSSAQIHTRARLALLGETLANVEVAARMKYSRQHMVAWVEQIIDEVGSPGKHASADLLVALIDGAILAAAGYGTPVNENHLTSAIHSLVLGSDDPDEVRS